MRGRILAASLTVSLFAAWAPVLAQSDDDKLRDQLRQTVLQLRQLQDTQATLQAQKTAAEQERDALRAELAAAQAELQKAKHGSSETAALQQSLARMKDAYSQAAGGAQAAQADRDKAREAAEATGAQLEQCKARNAELVKIGNEILTRYHDVDFVDVLGLREPFTGLSEVDHQNAVQDYADKIEDQRFDPNTKQPQQAKPNR
jgi:hypothetical protein